MINKDTKIAVLGDSHSRIFSNTNLFTPFFLGPGGNFNLTDGFTNLNSAIKVTLPILENDYEYIMLLLGEPTCRFQLKQDHHIHKKHTDFSNIESTVNVDFLKTAIDNYILVLEYSKNILGDKLLVSAPISVFNPSLEFSVLFSEKIKEYCDEHNIIYMDVKSFIIKDGKVDDGYKADPVHANQKIIRFYDILLSDLNLIDFKIILNHEENFDEIRSKYKFNQKFNCFTI